MRKVLFAPGEFYHIYNRGNDKKDIFMTSTDYTRFLFLILFFQGKVPFYNISRHVKYFVRHRVFNIDTEVIWRIIAERGVDLVSFTLMPNHFHLLLREKAEKGISAYMQRVLDAYTKYFNTKYEKSGHLFQGPFHAVHIETNEQLLYTSAYIHRNQRALSPWIDKEHLYPWSSHGDYIGKNRWGMLLASHHILEQFPAPANYRQFVEESGAKETEMDLPIFSK